MLVAEEDWQAIQETSHLLSVPGMHESIKKGMAEPLRKQRHPADLRVVPGDVAAVGDQPGLRNPFSIHAEALVALSLKPAPTRRRASSSP